MLLGKGGVFPSSLGLAGLVFPNSLIQVAGPFQFVLKAGVLFAFSLHWHLGGLVSP